MQTFTTIMEVFAAMVVAGILFPPLAILFVKYARWLFHTSGE